MERCNICNINILKKNFPRHERSQKHLINLQNYVPQNILDIDINEPNLQEPIQPTIYKPKIEKRNKKKETYEQLKREILNEFDDLEKNFKDISPEKIKKELKRVFIDIKTNKRKFQKIELENDKYKIEETDQALEGCFLTTRLTQEEIASVNVIIEELPEMLVSKLKNVLKQKKRFKLQIVLTAKFKKFHPASGTEEFNELTVPSKNRNIFREDEIKRTVADLLSEIHEKIESWDNNEGYWHLENVNHIDLKIREYKPLSGSSYIQTPKWISGKKATINIKNEDQKCFKYCMLYHKHKNEIKCHPERINRYKEWDNLKEFNFDGIKFPVEVNDLKKFCKQNDIGLNL